MTTLTTDVEPLPMTEVALWSKAMHKKADPFTNLLVATMMAATEDQLDVLDRAFPDLVHVVRVWRFHGHGRERITALLRENPRNQCPECGWPLFDGYQNAASMDGDVDPYGYCLNQECDFEY